MLPLHITLRNLVFVSLCLISFSSCSNKAKKNSEIIIALNESIENSNRFLAASTTDELMSLNSKLNDRGSHERAKVWFLKAEKVLQVSKNVYDYIENCKDSIYTKPINRSELFEKMKEYQRQILDIDPKITDALHKSLIIFTRPFDSARNEQKKLFHDYFTDVSSESVIAILNKLQNNIRLNEMRIITFCNEHVFGLDIMYLTYPVIFQSSNVVGPGDNIEITAGVLSSERYFDPKVSVYNKIIKPQKDGFAVYRVKAPETPGRYYVPIKIDYINDKEKQSTFQKQIEYTVANIHKE